MSRVRLPASMRARATVGAALVAAVVLVPLAALLSVQLQQAAAGSAQQLARDDLQPYAVDLRHQPDESPDPASQGVLVLVLDPDGTVRRNSMPSQLAGAVRGGGDREVALPAGRFEVAAERVWTAAGTWRLWAARDATAGAVLLEGVQRTLLVGTALAVLAVAAGSWVVAGRALRRVEAIRRRAERLRVDPAGGLLPVDGRDEVARLARTLNELLEAMRASLDRERALTADAAHELRMPVAVLAAQLEAAEREPLPDLAPARESLRHLVRLIDNLLTLARADLPQRVRPRTSRADLVTEAMGAIDRARATAGPAVQVDLVLGEGAEDGGPIGLDPIDFARILDNLLANALQHGAPLSIVTVTLTGDTDALVLRVQDDGVGMPAAFAPIAFERFARADVARARADRGSGLGLALVRQVAHGTGGDAVLAATPSGGAAVTVRLVVAPPPRSATDPGADAASFEHPKAPSVSTR